MREKEERLCDFSPAYSQACSFNLFFCRAPLRVGRSLEDYNLTSILIGFRVANDEGEGKAQRALMWRHFYSNDRNKPSGC